MEINNSSELQAAIKKLELQKESQKDLLVKHFNATYQSLKPFNILKNSLSKDFSIDASRLETDGKGASKPVSPNTTSEGKANNRRVEFIKL